MRWSFYQYHFLWDMFIAFITTTFLIYHKFPFLNSSGCLSKVCQMVAVSTFPWSNFSSIIPFTFDLNFTFQHYHFSHLWHAFIFEIHIFLKCHMGFSLGEKESIQWHALLSVHEQITDVQCPIANRLWRKRHD